MTKNFAHQFEKFLKNHSLKFTIERQTLLNEISGIKGHFDSESLYDKLRKKQLRISRDTVFRNLPLLLDAGILQKSVGEGKSEYFELVGPKGHHDHMVCVSCGKVIEFHSDAIEKIQDQLCKEYDFEMTFHDHRLFGHCKSCKK